MPPPRALHRPSQVAWLPVRPGQLPPEHGTSGEATAKPDTAQRAAESPRPPSWTTSVRPALPAGQVRGAKMAGGMPHIVRVGPSTHKGTRRPFLTASQNRSAEGVF